jgi:hypothetical protein
MLSAITLRGSSMNFSDGTTVHTIESGTATA